MASILLISAVFADLEVGETFPSLKLADQFKIEQEIKTKGATTLIFSFEKDVSAGIKKYIHKKEKDFLIHNNIMYISDISSMPSLITKMFAIPKMKKFNFSVSLIRDEKVGDFINRKKGKVTVIKLKDNSITDIKFVNAKALDEALK